MQSRAGQATMTMMMMVSVKSQPCWSSHDDGDDDVDDQRQATAGAVEQATMMMMMMMMVVVVVAFRCIAASVETETTHDRTFACISDICLLVTVRFQRHGVTV